MPWLAAIMAGLVVLVIDQSAKHVVLARPSFATTNAPRRIVALCCVINRRDAAFPGVGFMVCTISALMALTQEPLRHSALGASGIGLALGGIASNFIDLRRRGGIVDFLAIGPLPVCNIADFAILGGFALTAIALVQLMAV